MNVRIVFLLSLFFALAKVYAQSEENVLPDTSVIVVPKAFSPNADGIDDVLYIKTYHISNYKFELFDRWGELVYKTTDVNAGWNGRNKKDKLNEKGTYYYMLNYVDSYKKPQLIRGYIDLK